MQENRKKIFPLIIALSALSVSASAAFYSVTGLSKLFAGASTQVMIMAGSLEVAKLVIASLLYQYWNTLNKVLRTYLCIAATVLVLITSMGIYGYLSAAYQTTATASKNVDMQVTLLETKKQNLAQQRDLYAEEKNNLVKGISQLQTGLVGNKTSYVDRKGNLIQTSSSANRKAFEKQLESSSTRQQEVTSKLDEINSKIFELDTQIVDTKTNSKLAGELGPLTYISGLTGVSMDRVINWLLLIIIFVFDPLAIALVIAANFAFEVSSTKKHYRDTLYGEQEEVKLYEEIDTVEDPELLDFKKEPVQQVKPSIVKINKMTPGRAFVEFSDGTEKWISKQDLSRGKF